MKELMEKRLLAVRAAKEQLIGQINALVGRESELVELLKEFDKKETEETEVG